MTVVEQDTPTTDSPARGDESASAAARRSVPLSEALAWDGPNLKIASPIVCEGFRRPALSASTAKAMDGCPARWAAEKTLPSRENPFGAAELGTSAHSVLEDLFDIDNVKAEDRTEKKAMSILLAHSKEAWPGKDEESFANRGMWISEVHNAFKGLWAIEDPRTVSVYDREFTADGVEVNGVPFIGYIDRVDNDPNGFRVVDYKSSAKMPANITRFGDDHGDQMRLYAEVMAVLKGRMPAEALLYYTRLGKMRTVPLSKQKMRETLTKFKKSWSHLNLYIDNAEFPTKTSALCGWCPLVKVCPAAKAAGYVDRVGTAPEPTTLGIPVLRRMDDVEQHAAEHKRTPAKAPDFNDDFGSASVGETPPSEDLHAGDLTERTPVALDDDFGSAATVPAAQPVGPESPAAPALDDDFGAAAPEPAPTPEVHAAAAPVLDDDFASATPMPGPGAPTLVVAPTIAVPAPEGDLDPHAHPDTAFDLPEGWQPPVVTDTASISPRPAPETGSVPAPAAHLDGEAPTPTPPTSAGTEIDPMSTNLLSEDKSWFETVNGRLNPNSYAATAVFGTVSMAYEELHKAGVKVSKANIDALASTFAHIVGQAQVGLTGVVSYQDGANTRLRGALRSVIEANPMPWGQGPEAWDTWVNLATKHVSSIASAALRLHEADLSIPAWHELSVRQASNAG